MSVPARMKAIGPVSYLVVGMLAAIVGLLPWLVTGMHLPIQNLWAADSVPEDMPIALLPFSQYTITLVVAVVVTGSALAVAWCGLASGGRVAGAIVSFLALWIGPTLFTAVSAAAGTRVLAAYPAEMRDYGVQVFFSALGGKGGSIALLIPAVIVMVLGLAVRRALRRRRLQVALA
ncbi:hypothetical protein [Cryobacterium sp. PH31-L1]|uniref:hypothetical protein n=1 Tax=Cryobacterium sp. PH31-L1 TaxID=3046199 RepID=UPI0024B9E2C7|nr:hypothetical protein [Cryobacterium sp. PH31-L1]MDJ0378729.1 hypothetical protein [Cryobacterium sp. PH31-L1]